MIKKYLSIIACVFALSQNLNAQDLKLASAVPEACTSSSRILKGILGVAIGAGAVMCRIFAIHERNKINKSNESLRNNSWFERLKHNYSSVALNIAYNIAYMSLAGLSGWKLAHDEIVHEYFIDRVMSYSGFDLLLFTLFEYSVSNSRYMENEIEKTFTYTVKTPCQFGLLWAVGALYGLPGKKH